jgi:hypothetical protein
VFPMRYELDCYISSICILRTQYVYVFRIILAIYRDYFPKHHSPVGLCYGDAPITM